MSHRADEEAIKAYFPVSTVVPAILNIYKELLNVKFFRVPASAGGATWHPGMCTRLSASPGH